jgi:RES domain
VKRRDLPVQGGPVDVDSTFPRIEPGTSTLYLAHARRSDAVDGGCWFFTGLPAPGGSGGRFDLVKPRGTCYWSTSDLAAARERLGRPGDLIAEDEIEGAVVSQSSFDPGGLADLTAVDAARRGVTAELSSSTPYAVSQLWAEAFALADFDGVHYRPRFSTGPACVLALFGPAGPGGDRPPVADHRSLVDVLVDAGYTVLARPTSSDLGDLLG